MKGKRIFSLLTVLAMLASLLTVPAFAAESKTLTLREDWRLTQDLDLAVPAGTTLTIDGGGRYYIYELGGMLKNSGAGDVVFADGTILYPIGASESCTTETSNALMAARKTGGGSSTGGGGGGGSSSSTTTETVTNPDGSTTTTVTDKTTGTVTETTKYTDGSTTTTVTANGQVTTQVKLSQAALDAAQASGSSVTLPMPAVAASSSAAGAPSVTVDLPGAASAQVEIPVSNLTPGTVAVLVAADGTERVIKTTLATENGIAVTLSDGDTVKVVDNTKTFADVPSGYWGADEIAFAASRELFQGTGDTTFAPEVPMSRAMMLTVLARYNGVDTSKGSTWYEAGAAWAVETGISDGTNLDGALTREQLALMLYRYAGEPAAGSLSAFGDAENVSSWAVQAMVWATENGLINGVGGDLLNPQGQATRAQVAAILARFVTLVN